jgi:hypothetical protein
MAHDEYNSGLISGYNSALIIIDNLYRKLEYPETDGKLGEIPYQEQYAAYQAQKNIIKKAETKIKQCMQEETYDDY